MKTFVGFYDEAANKIAACVRESSKRIALIGILGSVSAGKCSVANEAFQRCDIQFSNESLPELASQGVEDLFRTLLSRDRAVLTGFDDIDSSTRSALLDLIISVRVEPSQSAQYVWIVPSNKPISFADHSFHLPDLPSDAVTHRLVCSDFLAGFPVDDACPLAEVFTQSTQKLSIGQLSNLTRQAKSLALSGNESLSCKHLSRSFHALALPSSPVSISNPSASHHVCEFSASGVINDKLDSFIGLSQDTREEINEYLSSGLRYKVLIISGPVGSGKSHLAAAVAWNNSMPVTRVTSADILRSKIGETEKTLHQILSSNPRVVIEDIDQLVPDNVVDATGSVQRCLPVLASFLDRLRRGDIDGSDRMIIGTAREPISAALDNKTIHIQLENKLQFMDKLELIKSQFPAFDGHSVTPFDLIQLDNRAKCVRYGNDIKLKLLRQSIASKLSV